MTLGTLRLRILKVFPGIDPDVLDGFISDRYGEILEELPWSRIKSMAVLQTVVPYSTGTVAATAGSTTVTLTGGSWDTSMTGREFRVAGRDEYYGFTWVSSTTATLDRPYEGPTAAAVAYKLFQMIYPLPANCRSLDDDAFTDSDGPLERFSHAQLNFSAPNRSRFGTPESWASYMDDSSTPPRMQVELYPIPDRVLSLPFCYVAEASAPTSGGTAFLPWMEPATALVEGIMAKIYRTPKFMNLAASQLSSAEAKDALSTMRNNEALRMAPCEMSLPSYYTSHRLRRAR